MLTLFLFTNLFLEVYKMINIRKRGKVYQYQFEIAPIEGKIAVL